MTALDPKLLAMLVCPVTRGQLTWLPDQGLPNEGLPNQELPGQGLLVSKAAGLAYRVRDGVPIMLVEDAIAWPPEGRTEKP